ncbi:hypothetical protein EYZ11_002491 [Aspergillus tanneri]|uniref:Rab guanine nucleotide exchange factor S2 n=1 Tax=Aspergillus tanneri TaxID=1220188 RepID=A0A4S3JR10_9EURO|nr:rab guanine nucleotide exchange factor S2 [Aspergillus tanneri]KAA8645664.1 rab guanine nucleotide exchange factor S2 [Aspergillus tanneri]THC98065.1 hypothetical protein EYZ11_002491 [Aspergillus tanneri]
MLPRPSHKRSLSSENRSSSPDRTLTKAKSTNDLSRVVTGKAAPVTRSTSAGDIPESGFSTLKDPRLGSLPDTSDESSSTSHHPDLSSEVAALSVKLVQAINNQTTLDDNLVATRQDLELAKSKICSLEAENEKYRRDIDEEILIKKSDVDYEILRLKAALADEKAQRALVEKEKKGIEQELETLTAALFEEANKMVAAAKLEREAVEKKNEQLRSQIKDTESLLASHQEQLAELKSVLHGANLSRDDIEAGTIMSTAPSSPAVPQQSPEIIKNSAENSAVLDMMPYSEELVPGPSTSFPQFIKSVCRTDLPAFEDFRDLFHLTAHASKPPSRTTSGSYTGLNVMSLASFGGSAFGSASSSPAKSQTHSPNGSLSSPQPTNSHIPLKETKFYKRVLNEDIEPTLRLDAAPGISWLTRRSVLSGICEGTLLVEPMPPATKKFEFPCSLCGERRSGTVNERTHRFRTSDSETAQRYPLCVLCLEKVRSACEFTGYLRLILDGHIRAGDTEEEKDFWEETIRLRERMFWSRIGGGIVPIFSHPNDIVTPSDTREEFTDATVSSSVESQQNADCQPTESTTVQIEHDEDKKHGHHNHRDSLQEDPFFCTPSESPASNVAVSPLHDISGAQGLNTTTNVEVSKQLSSEVTVPIDAADDNETSEVPIQADDLTAEETTANSGEKETSRN